MITIHTLAAFLDRFLAVAPADAAEPHGVLVPSPRPVQRLGLALEPWPALGGVLQQHQIDALLLHRPWQLDLAMLPAELGVLAYHRGFDAHLTIGYNPRLAHALGLMHFAPFAMQPHQATGMIGDCQPIDGASLAGRLQHIFGGYDQLHAMPAACRRIVAAGAMTDGLVRAAAAQGAQLYLTGQFRQPAAAAVAETGIGVAAIGHQRAEEAGLRALAVVLRERWTALDVLLLDGAPTRDLRGAALR